MYPEQDLNLHVRNEHKALNLARLPIPPPGYIKIGIAKLIYFYRP